jgi:hypothetical protein
MRGVRRPAARTPRSGVPAVRGARQHPGVARHGISDWRVVLLVGVALAVALATVGFAVQRSAVSIPDEGGLPYVHQRPTPFEVEVHLRADHNVVLADGDEDLWYHGAGVVLALTLGATPLLRARQAARAGG